MAVGKTDVNRQTLNKMNYELTCMNNRNTERNNTVTTLMRDAESEAETCSNKYTRLTFQKK